MSDFVPYIDVRYHGETEFLDVYLSDAVRSTVSFSDLFILVLVLFWLFTTFSRVFSNFSFGIACYPMSRMRPF